MTVTGDREGQTCGKERSETHAVKTATVCANTSPKFRTLRQILQFWLRLCQRDSFLGERATRVASRTSGSLGSLEGIGKRTNVSDSFSWSCLLVSEFRGTSFLGDEDERRSYDEQVEHRRARDLRQCRKQTCCRFGCR